LEEAVNSGAEIVAVLTAAHIPFPMPADTRVYSADRSLIDSISPLKNAQPTLFTCKMPHKENLSDLSGNHILLDGVQDPGNVGSIIRTANAFAIKSVILTGACADPYNPKTQRASMGAIFRQRIHFISISELTVLKSKEGVSGAAGTGVSFVGTAPDESCRDICDVSLENSLIAIGSEGRGLSEEVLSLCDEMIRIPISRDCESLNAATAAAIVIWESRSRM